MIAAKTREFLHFLKANPTIRDQIQAAPNKTLLYAGKHFQPAWVEIYDKRRSGDPHFVGKEILPDVLQRINLIGQRASNLLQWVQSLESLIPTEKNSYIAWRALSGLFAANAIGEVSFYIGREISPGKIFAAFEIPVLSRNPNLDALTAEVLSYYQDAIRAKRNDVNFSFIRG